jgi:hypothetical protein
MNAKQKKKLDDAKRLANEYSKIQKERKALGVRANEIEDTLKGFMDEVQRDTLLFPCDEDPNLNIKVSRYNSTYLSYDDKILLPVLREKGLAKRVCKISIDSKKLEEVFNEGLMTVKEISKAAIKSTRSNFKISTTKKRSALKKEIEEE